MSALARAIATRLTQFAASGWALFGAALVIPVWMAVGLTIGFSDTWFLGINTFASLVTFLMVFVLQNATGRDAQAVQLKLDELIRGMEGARTRLVRLEGMTDEELAELQREFQRIQQGEEGKSGGSAVS